MTKPDMSVTKAIDYKGQKPIADFLRDYSYYPELTKKLDAQELPFGEAVINEIVLWKIARYVEIPPETLAELESLKNLKQGEHRQAAEVLGKLLACNGVRLAMASTILRFANPNAFQIYDRHMCRALTGKFKNSAPTKASEATAVYWSFLDELIRQCGVLQIPFNNADRILYQFDKDVNPPLSGNED